MNRIIKILKSAIIIICPVVLTMMLLYLPKIYFKSKDKKYANMSKTYEYSIGDNIKNMTSRQICDTFNSDDKIVLSEDVKEISGMAVKIDDMVKQDKFIAELKQYLVIYADIYFAKEIERYMEESAHDGNLYGKITTRRYACVKEKDIYTYELSYAVIHCNTLNLAAIYDANNMKMYFVNIKSNQEYEIQSYPDSNNIVDKFLDNRKNNSDIDENLKKYYGDDDIYIHYLYVDYTKIVLASYDMEGQGDEKNDTYMRDITELMPDLETDLY